MKSAVEEPDPPSFFKEKIRIMLEEVKGELNEALFFAFYEIFAYFDDDRED